MTDKRKEIRDDEFRVIGRPGGGKAAGGPRKRSRMALWAALALAVVVGILLVIFWPRPEVKDKPVEGEVCRVFEADPIGVTTDRTFTERIDTLVGEVQLTVYLPHNATPVLTASVPSGSDNILAARAADIRGDNGKINEAFVCEGKALAFGMSKKGYCAILDGVVTIGAADDSPLFEEAVESGGYFFRQYPLVVDGALVENNIESRTLRRALCARAGQIFIAVSETEETIHSFAEALVSFDVENAIYLPAGYKSGGWYADSFGTTRPFNPECTPGEFQNETYIVWR